MGGGGIVQVGFVLNSVDRLCDAARINYSLAVIGIVNKFAATIALSG